MGGGSTQRRSIVSEVVDDKVEDSYDKETSDEVEEAFQNDQMLGSETELILRLEESFLSDSSNELNNGRR